jgi:F/Y-rich N-terminus/F/Y rich C-terminus
VFADAPDRPMIGTSSSAAFASAVQLVNKTRFKPLTGHPSGPLYMGFANPVIAKMIQDLDGARECRNYIWRAFEDMQPSRTMGWTWTNEAMPQPLLRQVADISFQATTHMSRGAPRSVLPIERDEFGKYKLPVRFGTVTLIGLGLVVTNRRGFHNRRYIWPVGFTTSR